MTSKTQLKRRRGGASSHSPCRANEIDPRVIIRLWKVWRAPNGSKARQAERYDAVLQRLLQHQREKAAEHVAADDLVEPLAAH